jgi:ADP-ribose pyrophosphatase YjhB (NUDIX family)
MVALDKDGLSEEEFLARYDAGAYERPAVTADIVLFVASCDTPDSCYGFSAPDDASDDCHQLPKQNLEVLLIRRGGHPYLGRWALPGGFLGPNETLDKAARRELREETGVDDTTDDVYLEQLRTFSKPGRDPRQWTVTGAYLALADRNRLTLKAGDDAADAALFKVTLRRDENRTWHLELTKAGEALHATLVEDVDAETIGVKVSGAATPPTVAAVATVAANQKTPLLTATNSDLAFDHADIIAYALQSIKRSILS